MLQSRRARYSLLAACLLMIPTTALAQEGTIAGTIRDEQGAVLPGVTVEATSPALIRVRTTISDDLGQYRITNLPVGTYKVTFTLSGFQRAGARQRRADERIHGQRQPDAGRRQLTETVVVAADVAGRRRAERAAGDHLHGRSDAGAADGAQRQQPARADAGDRHQLPARHGLWRVRRRHGGFCNPAVKGFDQGEHGRLAPDLAGPGPGRRHGHQFQREPDAERGRRPIVGMTGGYTADIANAQEVNIRVSGALGESETGGSAINIVPRTGGNRYAGNFNTTYTTEKWFATNNGELSEHPGGVPAGQERPRRVGRLRRSDQARPAVVLLGRARPGHSQAAGAASTSGRTCGKASGATTTSPIARSRGVEYTNIWRNVNARITWQATQKNKFNIFWDEQDFCQDPCPASSRCPTSPESWWSVQMKPNRLQQVSWTNPLTSRILLEARASVTPQDNHTDKHLRVDEIRGRFPECLRSATPRAWTPWQRG